MALLNHRHIIELIIRRLNPHEESIAISDIHDDFEAYTAFVHSSKLIFVFNKDSIEIYVFKQNPGERSYAFDILDTIVKISEKSTKEYSESFDVLYSAGNFLESYSDQLKSACKELSIETQVVSGSLYDKFVNWS